MFKKFMIAVVVIVIITSGSLGIIITAIPDLAESLAVLIEAIGNAIDKSQQGQQEQP